MWKKFKKENLNNFDVSLIVFCFFISILSMFFFNKYFFKNWSPQNDNKNSEVAYLVEGKKDVRLKRDGHFFWKDVGPKEVFFANESIFVGEDSQAVIQFKKNNDKLLIDSNSIISLKLDDSSQELQLGISSGSIKLSSDRTTTLTINDKKVVLNASSEIVVQKDTSQLRFFAEKGKVIVDDVKVEEGTLIEGSKKIKILGLSIVSRLPFVFKEKSVVVDLKITHEEKLLVDEYKIFSINENGDSLIETTMENEFPIHLKGKIVGLKAEAYLDKKLVAASPIIPVELKEERLNNGKLFNPQTLYNELNKWKKIKNFDYQLDADLYHLMNSYDLKILISESESFDQFIDIKYNKGRINFPAGGDFYIKLRWNEDGIQRESIHKEKIEIFDLDVLLQAPDIKNVKFHRSFSIFSEAYADDLMREISWSTSKKSPFNIRFEIEISDSSDFKNSTRVETQDSTYFVPQKEMAQFWRVRKMVLVNGSVFNGPFSKIGTIPAIELSTIETPVIDDVLVEAKEISEAKEKKYSWNFKFNDQFTQLYARDQNRISAHLNSKYDVVLVASFLKVEASRSFWSIDLKWRSIDFYQGGGDSKKLASTKQNIPGLFFSHFFYPHQSLLFEGGIGLDGNIFVFNNSSTSIETEVQYGPQVRGGLKYYIFKWINKKLNFDLRANYIFPTSKGGRSSRSGTQLFIGSELDHFEIFKKKFSIELGYMERIQENSTASYREKSVILSFVFRGDTHLNQ